MIDRERVAERVKDAIREGDGDVPLTALNWREDDIDRESPDYKAGFRAGWMARIDAVRSEAREIEHRRAGLGKGGWCGKTGLTAGNCSCLDGGMGYIQQLLGMK